MGRPTQSLEAEGLSRPQRRRGGSSSSSARVTPAIRSFLAGRSADAARAAKVDQSGHIAFEPPRSISGVPTRYLMSRGHPQSIPNHHARSKATKPAITISLVEQSLYGYASTNSKPYTTSPQKCRPQSCPMQAGSSFMAQSDPYGPPGIGLTGEMAVFCRYSHSEYQNHRQ